jgi:magnesium chelatase subunit D
MTEGGPEGAGAFTDAVAALALLAVDACGLGGASLRAPAGPVRDIWLGGFRARLPAGAPIRRVPANVTAGRLAGGLDLAATLAAGRPMAERGLLAEADGGALVLAMAERATDHGCSRYGRSTMRARWDRAGRSGPVCRHRPRRGSGRR